MGQVLFGSRQELDEFDSNFQDDSKFFMSLCVSWLPTFRLSLG